MSITTQPDAAPPPTEVTPSPAGSAKLMWAILGVVLVADLLDLLDATITNIAAPTIVSHLGGGPALVKWLGARSPPLSRCSSRLSWPTRASLPAWSRAW